MQGLDNMLAKYDASASWQLIPSAVKAGTAYAQVPNTSLGDLTVTRASSGTFTNSAGVVQTAANNVLRTDFRNADGTLSTTGRYLFEPQRTNLVTYSEQFDNAAWIKNSQTATANTTTSPDGTVSADTLTGNGTASSKFAVINSSITSGLTYTFSCYIKKGTNNFAQLVGGSIAFGLNVWANFDLNTGVVGSVGSSTTASIQDAGNGWYRCIMTGAAIATGSNPSLIVALIDSSTALRTASNSLSTTIFVWGAQLEVGAYATTYIPTTTAAVTRLADTASKTGVSSLIGQTEGTMFIDFYHDISINASSDSRFQLSDGSGANWIFIGFPEGNSKSLRFRVANSGSVVSFFSNTNIIQGRNKVAFAYKNGDFVGYLNGVQVASNTTALAIPSCSRIDLQGGAPTNPALERENITQAALFPTRLTNAQLAQLTTL